MKKLLFIFIATVTIVGTSCKKYLDINTNPNQATTVTPNLVLSQALAYTANTLNGFNNYGSQTGIYQANGGGFGSFGESITYNYTTSNTSLFNTSYDNLEDYQYVINTTNGVEVSTNFNAAARIMKAFHFQLLVDAFNSVPYFDALKADAVLTPAYDDPKVIYKDLADQLDSAIGMINAVSGTVGITDMGNSDVLFGGDMTKWKQFATTLKLRIILRAGSTVTFSNTDFSEGFLADDALINPGYTRDNGKQNPQWNQWAFTYTGTTGSRSWMPSTFVYGFYNGVTLLDTLRGPATWYGFDSTGTNRLGVESSDVPASPTGSSWYVAQNRDGASAGDTTGILKGPNAGYPIMLAAESYFLQAEAAMKGLIAGTSGDYFESGLLSAFSYTYSYPDRSTVPGLEDSVAIYKSDNAFSYLVNYNLANTDEKKLEAIITQKFIANNFVRGEESWNEYRRTHYPKINPAGDGYETFASSVSESPRPDKLPTRILYPTLEGSSNGSNVPTGISPFTSLIFWAQ